MAFAVTNKQGSVSLEFETVWASTAFQFAATATSTTAGTSRHWEFSDAPNLTATVPGAMVSGSLGDFGAALRSFRAYIDLKSLTAATGTTTSASIAGPIVALETATSTAFSPAYMLDQKILGGTSTGQMAFSLFGMTPIIGGCQFARINFYQFGVVGGMVSTAVDIILEGA